MTCELHLMVKHL